MPSNELLAGQPTNGPAWITWAELDRPIGSRYRDDDDWGPAAAVSLHYEPWSRVIWLRSASW
jgi:hypothetical protein